MSTDPLNAESLPSPDWWDLPVEHLQLKPGINDALRSRAVRTLGDALTFADSSRALQFAYAPELFECVRQLKESQSDDGIDWQHYWSARQFRFHQLAASCRDFDRLGQELAEIAVDRRSLGNAGAMLQAAGIRTFAQLVPSLRAGVGSVRGIGRTKIEDLFGRLFQLVRLRERGALPKLNRVGGPVADVGPTPVHSPARPPVADEIRQLPVSVLQIGVKSLWLKRAGVETIGDLLDRSSELRDLRAVGARTISNINRKLDELIDAAASGTVDWKKFSRRVDLPLIPELPPASAAEMISGLPDVISAIAPHLRDDSYRDVLFHRLTQPPGRQLKLEQIARRSRPPVSRERIRQKEKKLLGQLAGALIWNADLRLEVQFHPGFAAFWSQAAREFEGEEEIGFEDFVHRLAAVWQVTHEVLTPQLPFIVAVVTGEPQMRGSFRAAYRLDPALLSLSAEASAIPLRNFRLGKLCDRLEEKGIDTLGGLVKGCVSGSIRQDFSPQLAPIAASVRTDGTFDWLEYARAADLQPVPDPKPTSAREFARGFQAAICAMLLWMSSSDRRQQIFSLRTGKPARGRQTLQAVADHLGCYGPTVKREETLLLRELNDILVDRDFSSAPFWLDCDWLDHVAEAETIMRNSRGDYQVFLSRLSLTWGLSPRETELAAAGLWAIFTGYPQGRRRRRSLGEIAPPLPAVAPMRIKLRGFRRLH